MLKQKYELSFEFECTAPEQTSGVTNHLLFYKTTPELGSQHKVVCLASQLADSGHYLPTAAAPKFSKLLQSGDYIAKIFSPV